MSKIIGYKMQAKKLRERLRISGIEITHGTALEAIAYIYGFRDWNTLFAVTNKEEES